jgi:hypothetical protein
VGGLTWPATSPAQPTRTRMDSGPPKPPPDRPGPPAPIPPRAASESFPAFQGPPHRITVRLRLNDPAPIVAGATGGPRAPRRACRGTRAGGGRLRRLRPGTATAGRPAGRAGRDSMTRKRRRWRAPERSAHRPGRPPGRPGESLPRGPRRWRGTGRGLDSRRVAAPALAPLRAGSGAGSGAPPCPVSRAQPAPARPHGRRPGRGRVGSRRAARPSHQSESPV